MVEIKLFNEWDTSEVVVSDISLKTYINLSPRIIPHTHGLNATRNKKENTNLVERLANKLMRSGQGASKLSGKYIRSRDNCGKKLLDLKVIKSSLKIIEEKTKQNPVQVLVHAVEKSGLREDTTRIRRGGVTVPVAVDVAPLRRVDESLKNISLGTLTRSFKSKKPLEVSLAEEIMLAATDDNQSYAIKRRTEQERIAKSAR